MARIELYKDEQEEFRWRMRADNGQIIAVASQAYKAKTDAERGIEIVQKAEGTTEIYTDKKGEHRWRLIAGNNLIIATAGEGYKAQTDCEHGLAQALKLAPKATFEDLAP